MFESSVPAIEIRKLSFRYTTDFQVLEDISIDLPSGQLIGLIGPNGAGKSTLLKCILKLIQPEAGAEVRFWGQPLEAVRKRIAYVAQRATVDWDFPATVFDVALMGRYAHLGMWQRTSAADKKLALEALALVGMADLAKRQISKLSGGQQQRVFLARALAQQADLYLLDEPFAGVDMATEQDIITVLRNLVAAGKTIVVVHHDLKAAVDYFSWLVLLNHRVQASGITKTVFTLEQIKQLYSWDFHFDK